MAKCGECGKRIDGDSRFCKYCGRETAKTDGGPASGEYAYCARCGARIPGTSAYCLVCGTKAGQAPLPEPVQKPKPQPPAAPEIKKLDTSITNTSEMELSEIAYGVTSAPESIAGQIKRVNTHSIAADRSKMSRVAVAMALLLITGIAAIGVWRLLPYIMPGDLPPVSEAVLYVKDGKRLMLGFPDESPREISGSYTAPAGAEDTGGVRAVSSPDGKYIAYENAETSDGDGLLYLLDLSLLNRADLQPPEGNLLSEGTVKSFMFSQRGNYLIWLSSKGGLYGYDYKKLWLIDTDVQSIIETGDRQVLYTKSGASGNSGFDIYLRSVSMEIDDKVMIAQNVYQLLDWTKNYSHFVYTQGNAYSAFDIIRYDAKLYQSQTLVQSADAVIDVSAEQGAVIYAAKINYTASYDQLVDDLLFESDRNMKEPLPERFGLPENFEDIFGHQAEGSYDPRELIELQDEFYEEYQEYQRARILYDEKLGRDLLRAKASSMFLRQSYPGLTGYEILLYRDNVTQIIEDNVYLLGENEKPEDVIDADIEKDYAVYVRSDPTGVPSLDLSIFASELDIMEYIAQNIPRRLCFSRLGQSPAIIYSVTGAGDIHGFEVTDKADGLYFITGKNKTLTYCDIKNGVFGEPLKVDDDVAFIAENSKTFNGSMLYIKNAEGNTGDLYSIKEAQNPVPVAEGVSILPSFSSENSGKSLLYYRGYDLSGESRGQIRGELYLLIKQERLIVGDVYDYDYRDDKLIYLIRDWERAGKGELYLYREGGVTPVDTGVTDLLSIQ